MAGTFLFVFLAVMILRALLGLVEELATSAQALLARRSGCRFGASLRAGGMAENTSDSVR
jgi:hypothetical protein